MSDANLMFIEWDVCGEGDRLDDGYLIVGCKELRE